MEEARIQSMAEQLIRENPNRRILDFTLEGQKYWIKRKLGNGRNQLVKYSVEKEFYYEIARMTIAGESHPELVPNIQVLTPDYMVTLDGGPTLKNILGSKRREEERRRRIFWEKPAPPWLRFIMTVSSTAGQPFGTLLIKMESSPFWIGRTGCTPETGRSRRPLIFFFFSRASAGKIIKRKRAGCWRWQRATGRTAAPPRWRKRGVS